MAFRSVEGFVGAALDRVPRSRIGRRQGAQTGISRTATRNTNRPGRPRRSSTGSRMRPSPSSTRCRCASDTLKKLPKLKLIAVAATGTDVVDKAYCKANGITVVNIRNYAFNTVPEHVLALIFALRRNLLAYVEDVRAGRWGKAISSASSTIRSATSPARRSASSAMAPSASRWRSAPRRSACASCPMTCSRSRASSISRRSTARATSSPCTPR